ncbi:MAG: dephospho-CoA kinase [Verrucomicrobiota bacterium]
MKLGLTGGIGCGKSTVVGFFKGLGWRTLESDAIVRDLLSCDPEVIAAIRTRWGESVFSDLDQIDRKALAKIVFASKEDLRWLESLLHPKVRKIWTAALANDPDAKWLVEIPLLFEKSLESEFDFVVSVVSPAQLVEQRMADRGYSKVEVSQRRSRQIPLEKKARLADYVITNSGNLEFLEKQTTRLSHQLTTVAGNCLKQPGC